MGDVHRLHLHLSASILSIQCGGRAYQTQQNSTTRFSLMGLTKAEIKFHLCIFTLHNYLRKCKIKKAGKANIQESKEMSKCQQCLKRNSFPNGTLITVGNWGLQLNFLGGKKSLSSCIVTMLKLSQQQPLPSICNSGPQC